MTPEELTNRTKTFAVRVIKMTDHLPNSRAANVIANQIIRSSTSIGANYREACRARSNKEFIAKIGLVIGETDETKYWLELISETEMLKAALLQELLKENEELLAIFIASCKTAKLKE